MAMLTFEGINTLGLRAIGLESFRQLLDSVPAKERMKHWTQICPSTLERLPTEMHEALLDRLPQCGAIKQRQSGNLRVLSLGFNVHIAGQDPRCAYPIDFCVRINGYQAAINLLLRPSPGRFSREMLSGMVVGPTADFFDVMRHMSGAGLCYSTDYELILLKMFRPCCPNALQWGTAGGTFSEPEERRGAAAAQFRGWKETQEEFSGYHILGWTSLVDGAIYQSGNVYEIQHIGVSIGYIPSGDGITVAESEGILGWQAVPLMTASHYLKRLTEVVSHDDPDCIFPDAKIGHGIEVLMPRLRTYGILFDR